MIQRNTKFPYLKSLYKFVRWPPFILYEHLEIHYERYTVIYAKMLLYTITIQTHFLPTYTHTRTYIYIYIHIDTYRPLGPIVYTHNTTLGPSVRLAVSVESEFVSLVPRCSFGQIQFWNLSYHSHLWNTNLCLPNANPI